MTEGRLAVVFVLLASSALASGPAHGYAVAAIPQTASGEGVDSLDEACQPAQQADDHARWQSAGIISAIVLGFILVFTHFAFARLSATLQAKPHLLAVLLGVPLSILAPGLLLMRRRMFGVDVACAAPRQEILDWVTFVLVYLGSYFVVGIVARWLHQVAGKPKEAEQGE